MTGRPSGVLDLDLYGDVVAAYGASTRGPGGTGGLAPLSVAWPALAEAVDWLGDHWGDPDAGVWESAGPPALLVASRVQAWSALDRMARLGRAANPLDLQAAAWHQEARRLLTWLETEGIAADGGLRRDGAPGRGDEPDAALLRIAWRGPWPLAHPSVAATVDRVLEQLGSNGFVYRHSSQVDDGRAGPDSPDLLASLWAVRALARLGRWEDAHARMEAVVAAGGHLGLLAEAADPVSGELMGNLPGHRGPSGPGGRGPGAGGRTALTAPDLGAVTGLARHTAGPSHAAGASLSPRGQPYAIHRPHLPGAAPSRAGRRRP